MNESQLRASLYNAFSPYTGSLKAYEYMYCAALGQNVSVRINESRDSYRLVSSGFDSFLAGTGIAAIGLFLSVSTGTVALWLTYAGVLLSGATTINTAITLWKSGKYNSTAQRHGYVYDTTVYNENVHVTWNTSSGEFSGGYNNAEEFTWIISTPPSTFAVPYSTNLNQTLHNYNADIALHGMCYTYSPD